MIDRDLTEAERAVARQIKGLVRKFKFSDEVAERGESAPFHFGFIEQDVESAFVANGLDPRDYAIFDYDEAGKRRSMRYDQLLAFVVSAI